jgi:hypothetical protein
VANRSVVIPEKEKAQPGRTRSLWAEDLLWEEIQLVAKRSGHSVSKTVGFLLRAGLAVYRKQLEAGGDGAGKSASDEKP